MDYEDYKYCMNHDKYDLGKITKQIRTKKFIYEAPIWSGKYIIISKWISLNKTERFMINVPTVNYADELYIISLCYERQLLTFCVYENEFKELHKDELIEVNIIITTYKNHLSKWLGDIIKE